jgi:hypothetical protein
MQRGLRLSGLLLALTAAGFGQSRWQIPTPAVRSLSAEEAKSHVIAVSRFYREDATPGFHEAALYISAQARQYGLSDVHIETFPTDGVVRHFNMKTRYAWTPRGAALWLVNPELKLADFRDATTHLATWSQGANVTAELVDVGGGSAADFQGKDVRGKIVFTSSEPAAVQHEAVTMRGALGIVSWWSPPARASFPDEVNWLDVANNRLDEVKTFAFVLSRRQGEALRKRLQAGPVKIHAIVDADLGSGNLEVVNASIPGSDPAAGEIILSAHICHFSPSSNDDASGVGLLLELARTWKSLIASGAMVQPRRTIRFLWVPENYGTVAYLEAHPEVSRTVKAVIDLDMVGEDEDKCNSLFRVVRTPDSRPSFLADLLEHFTEVVAAQAITAPTGSRSVFRYAFNEYIGGSDHVWYNDAGVGVPAVLLTHWPDNFYHSSEDTPDKVDPSELFRVGLITFATTEYLANADSRASYALAQRVAIRGHKRIAEEMNQALDVLADSLKPEQAQVARRRLTWQVEREARAIISTVSLGGDAAAISTLANDFRSRESALVTAFLAQFNGILEQSENEQGLSRVYTRKGRYLSALWEANIRMANLPADEEQRALDFLVSLPYGDDSAAELFNLVNGKNTLADIRNILELERIDEYIFNDYFGDGSMASPVLYSLSRIDPMRLKEFFLLAEKAGLVTSSPK